MILLDTNVVSEAMRLRTADALVAAVAGANAFSVAMRDVLTSRRVGLNVINPRGVRRVRLAQTYSRDPTGRADIGIVLGGPDFDNLVLARARITPYDPPKPCTRYPGVSNQAEPCG